MLKIKEAILVEGKYDKHTLSGLVDTLILTTGGFGIFKDTEKRALLKHIACTRGLVILTDSDSAGFLIRNHLKSVLPKECVKHAYIPDEYGKERRKVSPSCEGKLGVEGMSREVLERSIRQAGVTVLGESAGNNRCDNWLSKAALYELGLSGGTDAATKRKKLLKRLELPERMSCGAMLAALNTLYTPEQWANIVKEL